jgi:hypothetical protein
MKLHNRTLFTAAFAAASLLTAATAEAKIYAYGAYGFNFSATPTTGYAAVPLTDAGKTSLKFKTTKDAQPVIISFTAECSIDSASAAWVDIDVLVDGVAIAPTAQTSDAFCGADSVAGFDPFTSAAVNVVAVVPVTGSHIVEVRARASDNTSGIWVSDTSIIVHD